MGNTQALQNSEAQTYRERKQINIKDNETGYGYETVFGKYLGPQIGSVSVEDPYIRTYSQCQNFLRFVEMLVKRCSNLKRVSLVTGQNDNDSENDIWLEAIKRNLQNCGVVFVYRFSQKLHDRQIMLSDGCVIKVGRGLNYFKKGDNFNVGFFDLDLRPCKETVIDIYHTGVKNNQNNI